MSSRERLVLETAVAVDAAAELDIVVHGEHPAFRGPARDDGERLSRAWFGRHAGERVLSFTRAQGS
jgi:hypothetical protein